MNRLLQIYAWGTLGLAFLTVLIFAYWLLFPYKILTFKDDIFPVTNKSLKVGDFITYKVDACKLGNYDGEVSRVFEDELSYPLALTNTTRGVGCETRNVTIEIPRGLPADTFRLKINYRYHPNPFRTITYTKYTEQFTVTK